MKEGIVSDFNAFGSEYDGIFSRGAEAHLYWVEHLC